MKAIILAAGKGERLGEITMNNPKPMIIFNNKTLLEHNIDLCKKNNITDIYINLHYLPFKIKEYFSDGSDFGVNIKYSYESELLGTAGAIKKIVRDYNINEKFFVIYGDNYHQYFDFNYIINRHNDNSSLVTIALHYRKDVTNSGLVNFDINGKIFSFIEKPDYNYGSNWVNAGVYFLNKELVDYIPEGYSDFSKDIFPFLIKNNISMYSILLNTDVKSFDTIEMLKSNE